MVDDGRADVCRDTFRLSETKPFVSATIVIIADKGKPNYVWIALVPLALFFFLDAYYLGLERRFRTLYNDFVQKVHAGTATTHDT